MGYLLSSGLWCLAGLTLGFALGWVARNVYEIRRRVVDGLTSPAEPRPRRRQRRRWIYLERVLGVIIVIMSVVTVLLSTAQISRLNRVIDCQAQYNQAFAESIKIRADATVQERERQKELWLTFLRNAPKVPGEQTPESRLASINALNAYLAALDDANHARQVAPIPTTRCTARSLL